MTDARMCLRRALRLRRYDDARAMVLSAGETFTREDLLGIMEESAIAAHRAYSLVDWLSACRANPQQRLAVPDDTPNVYALTFTAAQWARISAEEREILAPVELTPEGGAIARGPRYIIRVAPGTRAEQVDAAEAAVLDSGFNLYEHAGRIVRLGWVDTLRGREELRLMPVDETHLTELMGRAAEWRRFDARRKAEVVTGCPEVVARTYLARGAAAWGLPRLTGVLTGPSLRPDGTLLQSPGRDEATGLFMAPSDSWPWIPNHPDHAAASNAMDDLCDLLTEFPFVGEADFAVALAAILTATIRRSLPSAPLFAFTAPAPGTGKSLLVDLVALIGTGQPAAGFTWSRDDAENRKQLDAALLASSGCIALDNVTAPVGGDRLNQITTQPAVSVRVLGASRVIEVPTQVLLTANGNNLTIEADMTRRAVLCRLDSGVERPELREFQGDPAAAIIADRGKYLAACLTILRAYHVAGRPRPPKALGGFEAWSGLVRGALLWLGLADPVATMSAVRDSDPARAAHAAVAEQWRLAFGAARVTSAQVISGASHVPEFREALLTVAGANGAINTQRLGYWLRAVKDKMVNGLVIEPAGTIHGVGHWRLRDTNPATEAANVVTLPGRDQLAAGIG